MATVFYYVGDPMLDGKVIPPPPEVKLENLTETECRTAWREVCASTQLPVHK